MGIASQGEGSGKGSSGHEARGVSMGMRRVPHRGPAPAPVSDPRLPPSAYQPPPKN